MKKFTKSLVEMHGELSSAELKRVAASGVITREDTLADATYSKQNGEAASDLDEEVGASSEEEADQCEHLAAEAV